MMKFDSEAENCRRLSVEPSGPQLKAHCASAVVAVSLPHRAALSSVSLASLGKRYLMNSLMLWNVLWIYLTSALKSTKSSEC